MNEEIRNANFLSEHLKERDHREDLHGDERIILKRI